MDTLYKDDDMTRSVRVVPAILTDDLQALRTMLEQAETYTDYVQIDIMDSKFVPSRSITWEQISSICPKIGWEVHLMVEKPETQIKYYQQAGAKKAIFHFEATNRPDAIIDQARKLGIQVGLAINPETPVSKILAFTDLVDSVLFLSVHPGFYGAKFLPEVMDKVIELRRAKPFLNIGLDGGVKESNIGVIANSGVDDIFVGSAILLQADPGKSYRKLSALANSAI
jgi:ribulose-phosphate 3-epimerase